MKPSRQIRLGGVIPPLVTPLTSKGHLDREGLERLVDHVIAGGVSGVFALGSSGEGPWFPPTEQHNIVRTVVEVVGGRVPVLAGVIEPSTPRALSVADGAVEAGADVLVVASPYYYPATPAAQIDHVVKLSQSVSVPVVIYNIPQTTHNTISPSTVAALSQVEGVIGIKDSAGNWEAFEEIVRVKEDLPEFAVLQGAEALILRSMLIGADGVVPGSANLAPALLVALVAQATGGNQEEGERLQRSLDRLSSLHDHGLWLECLKYAAAVLGFGTGEMCGRPRELSQTAREAIEEIVAAEPSLQPR